MAKDGAMPEITEIIKTFSLSTPEKLQQILSTTTEEKVVAIITGINSSENYWSQEERNMQDPIPNMSRRRSITHSICTFDVFRKGRLLKLFADFLLKAVRQFPHLALYVHEGEFGFGPVFGVRYLHTELKSPYLIKFKERHFPQELYTDMTDILYSEENVAKHAGFGLKEIRPLSSYDY